MTNHPLLTLSLGAHKLLSFYIKIQEFDMLLPLNFAAGAIVGAAMTYVFKDQAAKEKVMSSFESLRKKKEDSTITEEQGEDIAEEAVEVQAEDVQPEKTA